MRLNVLAMAVLSLAASSGCNRTPERLTSLVGATKVPSPEELQKETIIMARVGGKGAKDLLNIELRPPDSVEAVHYLGDDRTKPVAQVTLQVSASEVQRLRRMLWRLRPDDGAPAHKTVPMGCDYIDDASGDWSIAYVSNERPADLNQFTLPYAENCKSRAYGEAQRLIGQVLAALPRSALVKQFPPGRLHPLATYKP